MYTDPTVGLSRPEAVARLRRFGVTPAMVSMWALRGWVDPTTGERRRLRVVGVDSDGARRYRHDDLLAAEAATALNPRRSHRQAIDTDESDEFHRAAKTLELTAIEMRQANPAIGVRIDPAALTDRCLT